MKIIHHGAVSDNLRNLASLAKCHGVDSEFACVWDSNSLASSLLSPDQAQVVLDVSSLAHLCDLRQLEALVKKIGDRDLSLLLLVTGGGDSERLLLQVLSDGIVRGIEHKLKADSFCFPAAPNHLVGELAAHCYRRTHGKALTLTVPSLATAEVLMNLGDSPAFVRLKVGRANVFIWSTDKVFDMRRPLAAEREFEEAADQYIPAIIFLRFAFGEQCWHNQSPGAGLVIDDPLLTKHYGFIKFPQLLESAKRHKYHVTLAFIPWNHWRSRRNQVDLFRRYSDCFSICTHGCDHSNNEFKSADYQELLSKNFVASERMRQHTERTGLGCEPLMVCPQEEYSLEAMRAFADSRQFIGLVCTSCIPRNLSAPQISGADLLLPAQDSFFGFPVFKRHYLKGEMSPFAMALFLGKHAILVEHHEFFKNGPGNTEKFVEGLAKLRPNIKWKSLAETATGTHLIRQTGENKREVRFFTDVFNFEHKSEKSLEYRFFRRFPENSAVLRVLVNGAQIKTVRDDGFVTFEIRPNRPQTLGIQVEINPMRPARSYSFGIKYQASVACRRFLSELRDNVIVRNDMALRASRFLARTLKQTSD